MHDKSVFDCLRVQYTIFSHIYVEWRLKRQKCVGIIAEEDRPGPRKLCRHASEDSRNRHSKQSSLGKTGSESQIKQTSSLELEHPGDDYPYWKSNQSVRRLNSNSVPMETHLMNDHPQSLEIISKKGDTDNNKISSHPLSLEVNFSSVLYITIEAIKHIIT